MTIRNLTLHADDEYAREKCSRKQYGGLSRLALEMSLVGGMYSGAVIMLNAVFLLKSLQQTPNVEVK